MPYRGPSTPTLVSRVWQLAADLVGEVLAIVRVRKRAPSGMIQSRERFAQVRRDCGEIAWRRLNAQAAPAVTRDAILASLGLTL